VRAQAFETAQSDPARQKVTGPIWGCTLDEVRTPEDPGRALTLTCAGLPLESQVTESLVRFTNTHRNTKRPFGACFDSTKQVTSSEEEEEEEEEGVLFFTSCLRADLNHTQLCQVTFQSPLSLTAFAVLKFPLGKREEISP